jgi:hypothetical protein
MGKKCESRDVRVERCRYGVTKRKIQTHPTNRGWDTLRVFLVFGGVECATFQGDARKQGGFVLRMGRYESRG